MSNELKKAEGQKPKQNRPRKSEQMKLQTNAGDNSKYLLHNMSVMQLADIDIDLTSPAEVRQRTYDYLQLCAENDMKPSVAGYALAFGVDRTTIWRWGNDRIEKIAEPCRKIIKQTYNLLTAQMEDYMQNGKINPVAGIFIMKNNMGYEDKKEITLAPANQFGDETPPEELQKKYLDAIEAESSDRAESD